MQEICADGVCCSFFLSFSFFILWKRPPGCIIKLFFSFLIYQVGKKLTTEIAATFINIKL